MMKTQLFLLVLLVLTCSCGKDEQKVPEQQPPLVPPYHGTIFIESDVLGSSDITTFTDMTYAGTGSRTVFDRRINDWTTINAYLFEGNFDDGIKIEAQINPEFGSEELAAIEATKYFEVVGKLPTILRKDVDALWIHKGTELFGGGNRSILIHTGQSVLYENDGILEETLIHEAAHTSLDIPHATHPDWIASQKADRNFISTYARDNSQREDIAESYLMYLAIRYRTDRISSETDQTVTTTIPNRIDYFDAQNFSMHPWE